MYPGTSDGSEQSITFLNKYHDSNIQNTDSDIWRSSSIQRIRKLLEEQGVVIPSHCDQFILRCLRVKDYEEDKTAKLLKNFGIMMRLEEMQDLFQQFIPSQFKDLYYSGYLTPLSQRDSQGRLILLAQIGRWNPEKFDFDQALAAAIVLFNYCNAKSTETQRCGVLGVFDCRGWNLKQMRAIKIGRFKIALQLMQDSCPAKIKGFHFLHHPRLIKLLFALISPFLKKKLTSRINFHNDESSLHQFIGPEVLPEILGGTAQNDSYIDEDILKELLTEDKYNQDMVAFGYPSC